MSRVAGPAVPLAADCEQHTMPAQSVRVALIGTFAPRKCGIATFTTDIFEQLGNYCPDVAVDVYALDDPNSGTEYKQACEVVDPNKDESYRRAAHRINRSGADCAWIQHEFGIFGPNEGAAICGFVDEITLPLIFTLHTVLTDPSPHQFQIIRHLIGRATRIMVMSHQGRNLLVEKYGAPAEIVDIIPHGAPDRPFGRQETLKEAFGLVGQNVLMTFGLLGPGKGLESVIAALPAIVERHPNTLYRIVGATHPTLIAAEGERYRRHLEAQARELGVEKHIEWDDRFLETPELLNQLETCDIYVTPYLNLQQSTSGTLSYAVALGRAVVSTPYVHARELLADGAGVLVEPNSSAALAEAVNGLLDDREWLSAMQRRAYRIGRTTIWPQFARAGAKLIRSAVNGRNLAEVSPPAFAMQPVTQTVSSPQALQPTWHDLSTPLIVGRMEEINDRADDARLG
ncbi:MAG: glycosyltransferase [Pseudomonas sp.]|nr:MAG: glycosyltransferase [Pseudomonas sp.]